MIGTLLLSACPISIGFLKCQNLKQNQNKIEKIIELINWIITEIRYKKTEINLLFHNLSFEENFKNLEFLQNFKNIARSKPFPKAWEESIKTWNCTIPLKDKMLLKSLSNILGATDSKGQILALKHIKMRFKESLKTAQNLYTTKGKLAKSLGVLLSIAIIIIFI